MNCCVAWAPVEATEGVTTSGDVTVTVVNAVLVLSEVSVAVTVHGPAANGAVYNPVLSIVPHDAVNVADWLVVNCWVAFSLSVGLSGDSVNAGAAPIVSAAVAVYAVPLAAVAVMVHTLPCVAEAVNKPFASMLPHEAAQVTEALAVNCSVWPWPVVALAGVIVNGDGMVAVVEAL